MDFRWAIPTAIALNVACNATASQSTSQPVAFTHLLGGTFVYGQTSEGVVYGGKALSTEVSALNGSVSLSFGAGKGVMSVVGGAGIDDDYWVCAVRSDGQVQCAGRDTQGSLGTIQTQSCEAGGGIPPSAAPVCSDGASGCYTCVPAWSIMPNVKGATQVNRSCALVSGVPECWAAFTPALLPRPAVRLAGMFAILDNGDLLSIVDGSPIALHDVATADSDYTQSADNTACAVLKDGSLYCWGSNDSGQVGDGTHTLRAAPFLVGVGYLDVKTSGGATCALRIGGAVACWGAIGRSTLGPVTVAGITQAVELADLSTVLLGNGSVVAVQFANGSAPTFTTIHATN